jgi:AcrR family transcriptional regulator
MVCIAVEWAPVVLFAAMTIDRASVNPQLPRGRHGLTRGAVIENQRQRLVRAVPLSVEEKGYLALTVDDICRWAGVSRRTFYENYRDKPDCFLASYRHHAQELMVAVGTASAAGDDPQERARFALQALLRYLTERPAVARMAVIEVMAAGPAALAERDQAVALLTSLIGPLVLEQAHDQPPQLLLEVVSGAILQLIYGAVLAGRCAELEELLPASMYMVLVGLSGPVGAAAKAGLLAPEAAPE